MYPIQTASNMQSRKLKFGPLDLGAISKEIEKQNFIDGAGIQIQISQKKKQYQDLEKNVKIRCIEAKQDVSLLKHPFWQDYYPGIESA